jgi:predicted transcriptional regulator
MDWLSFGLAVEGEQLSELLIGNIERRVPTCRDNDSVEMARKTAAEMGFNTCAVVNEQNVVLGLIGTDGSQSGNAESPVSDVMKLGPKTLRPGSSVKEATKVAQKNSWPEILVTSSDGKLMGIFKAGARISEQTRNR